jgi:PAS domain S-box-containing protein
VNAHNAGSVWIRENTLRIVSLILASAFVIFYIDIITPLGLTVWILYFIPLFLTLYWEWRYGPFVVTAMAIILIAASFFLSPRDVSLVFALLNRVFFSLMIIVFSLLIWNHKQYEENIIRGEERYRNLVEWLPDAIVVYLEGSILYVNPASLYFFGADQREDLVGRDLLDMIEPDHQQVIRERITQAAIGARMLVPDVPVIRRNGRQIRADFSLGDVYWDGKHAVLIVAREHHSPSP